MSRMLNLKEQIPMEDDIEKRMKDRKRILQDMAQKSISSSKELGLESIEEPLREVRRLRKTEKSALLPSKEQLKVMVKEAGIGAKELVGRAGEKAKKFPYYFEAGAVKIGKFAGEKIKEEFQKQREYEQQLAEIRRQERLKAVRSKYAIEERRKFGLMPRTSAPKKTFEPTRLRPTEALVPKLNVPLFIGRKSTAMTPKLNLDTQKNVKISKNLFMIGKSKLKLFEKRVKK